MPPASPARPGLLPARWRELQGHFDAALTADTAARDAQLQRLEAADPALAAQLRSLLAVHAQALGQGFLQQAPGALPFQAAQAGQRLGAWTLLQPLGEGGMGTVWLARRDDGHYQGQAAVKLLNRSLAGASQQDRFRQEGQILARLTHPHIAHLLDAGVAPGGQPYLVLAHVQGRAIDQHCDALRLGLAERIGLFVTLLQAVGHAHQHLVVHRDIKPSNVMVTDDGQLQLLDFGIAKLLSHDEAGAPADSALTQQGGSLLTPGHAAPEQLQRLAITTATDVYALGVLLFLLLSGRHPTLRPGIGMAELMHLTLTQDAPRLSAAAAAAGNEAAALRGCSAAQLQRALRGDLDNIVAKALQRDPAGRYTSTQAFADDLQRHLHHQPVLARRPGLAYRAGRFVQRQRVPLGVATAGLLALAVVGHQAWQQQQAARQNQTRAQTVDGLLQSLFEGMSPDVAASRSFSARELLDRGQAFLDRGSHLDAATRRSARARMAGLYREIGAYDEAARAFAAEVQETAGQADPRGHALALWNLADVQLKQRNTAAAGATLKELAARLPPDLAQEPLQAGRLAVLQGEWLLSTQQVAEAVAAYGRADGLLARLQPPDLELQARSAQGHGWSLRLAGRIDAAAERLQRATVLMQQRGERATVDRLNLEVQLGALDNWSGRFQQAAERLTRTHAELAARLGPQHALAVLATSELAVAELRQGQFTSARLWLARLQNSPDARTSWRGSYADALEARIQLYEGHAARAAPALEGLLAASLAGEGRPTGKSEPLRRLLGEALLRLGRASEAEAVLRANITHLAVLNKTARHNSVAASQVLLGCARARQGDLAEARRLWADADALLHQQLGPQHPFAVAAAAYATLADPGSTPAARQAVAVRVQQSLGWQDGAAELLQWLPAGSQAADWSRLPVVL